MPIIQISGCLLLLSAVVMSFGLGGSGVINVTPPTETVSSAGSLIIHYKDKTTYKIDYESSSQDCRVNNLPRKKIAKVVVNAAKFMVYSKNGWKGRMASVSSVGRKEYSVEEINRIARIKSVEQHGCRRKQKP